MYDFSFDCQNSLAGHAALRAELASLMAEFERQHGPAVTEPILIRCDGKQAVYPGESGYSIFRCERCRECLDETVPQFAYETT